MIGAAGLGHEIGYVGELMTRKRGKSLAVLNHIIRVLDQFREVSPTMTITNVLAFLYAARDEDVKVTQSDLALKFDVGDSSMSRMVRALTAAGDGRVEGLGLIELWNDPHDSRRKLLVLTPEGRRLRDKVVAALVTPPDA